MINYMSLTVSIDGNNGVTEGAEMGCYLASGSRDQTVRIWSTARGKGDREKTHCPKFAQTKLVYSSFQVQGHLGQSVSPFRCNDPEASLSEETRSRS